MQVSLHCIGSLQTRPPCSLTSRLVTLARPQVTSPPASDLALLAAHLLLAVGQADGAGVVGPLDLLGQAQNRHVIGEMWPLVLRVGQDLINLQCIMYLTERTMGTMRTM